MSKGKRFKEEEPKLNIKKVIAVFIAIIVIIMFVLAIKFLVNSSPVVKNAESSSYFSMYTNGKWGVIDNNAKTIIEPTYDEMIIIPDNQKDIFICTYDVDYKKNTYFQSIFNLFKNKGYEVSSYHDYTDQYYERTTLHKNLGSNYFGAKSLNINPSATYGVWPSENSYEIFSKNEKYFAFLTTVTSHAPYNRSSEYGDKYLNKFKDLDVSIEMKRYLSKLTEVDLALQKLLENLENENKLDDTVIVIFGDHYPYALNTNSISKMLDYDVTGVDIDKTPKTGYLRWRSDDGKIYAFPNIK